MKLIFRARASACETGLICGLSILFVATSHTTDMLAACLVMRFTAFRAGLLNMFHKFTIFVETRTMQNILIESPWNFLLF